VPTSLHEIGASLAVFLRRHSPDGIDAGLQAMRVEQRLRLLRFMVAGLCDPRDVGRLLATLEGGVVEGLARPLRDPEPLPAGDTEFLPFEGRIPFHGMEVLVGRPWQRNALRRKAEALIARGRRATVYLFGLTARYHVVRFHPSGFWEQSGGQFGRSTRNGPLFQGCSMARRVVLERRRTQETRELTRN